MTTVHSITSDNRGGRNRDSFAGTSASSKQIHDLIVRFSGHFHLPQNLTGWNFGNFNAVNNERNGVLRPEVLPLPIGWLGCPASRVAVE